MSDMREVIAKVRKLQALARKNTSVHEAAAAAAAADRLIQEHRIATAVLEEGGDAVPGVLTEDAPTLRETGRRQMWRWHLLGVIAEHYGCAVTMETETVAGTRQRSAYLVGREDDMAFARVTFEWVEHEIRRLCTATSNAQILRAERLREQVREQWNRRQGSTQRVSFGGGGTPVRSLAEVLGAGGGFDARAFCLGAASAVADSLERAKQEAMRAASKETAIVLVDRYETAREAQAAAGVVAVMKDSVSVVSSAADFYAGELAGRSIDVAAGARPKLDGGR